jgi:Fanconi-associated nuclease 1
MALQPRRPDSHNRLVGQRISHPKSTNFFENENRSPRPLKRVKREETDDSATSDAPTERRVIPDSDADSDDEEYTVPEPTRRTDLETALPPISTDQEAIDEYEASRAAEAADANTAGDRLNKRKWIKGRSSIYVDAFNLALETVLDEESHLFDEAEKALFQYWSNLSYEAQYLSECRITHTIAKLTVSNRYVRLFLRKTSAWHRIKSLGYHSDIANLEAAVEELQQLRQLPESHSEPEHHPGELEPPPGTTLEQSFTFADHSDLIITLEEASSLLKLDELKSLAKEAKVQGKNKKELLEALRRTSKRQTGLGSILRRSDTSGSAKSEGDASPYIPADAGANADSSMDTDDRNRDAHFTRKIMNETGPCIRLALAPLKLFERVHLVFYRSTEWTEKSLTTIILARIARWNFPEYIVSRSASIFESRALLVEFEASLRTQFRIDAILEFNGRPTAEGYQEIIDVYNEVYPRWRTLLAEELRKENHVYESGEGAYLRRLSPAWVYTRIIHKAADVLGKLKKHKEEHSLLSELLSQRLFHHARRGAWYQRKALLEEHYMAAIAPQAGRSDENQKKHWKRVALESCEEGLQDSLVHVVAHYDLQKRITKLEKALKIAKRLQHDFSHVRLAAPVEVYIEGVQIQREVEAPQTINRRNSSPHPKTFFKSTKTIWVDPLEDGECSVEAMCLSNYRKQGWKGYHSEGRIVRTLFAYLFFDIIFTYVPNVFQTAFQQCPLDLHTDAFYPSRMSEINHRLAQISNGEAKNLIRKVWDEHNERQTCVVGLDWTYPIEDLMEIAEYFDGQALATVCKVMAQEYRGGGMPDLFLWHTETKTVKFAEVKSENDRLSDTQRLWIHVLTGAGVVVELTNAVAKEVKVVG